MPATLPANAHPLDPATDAHAELRTAVRSLLIAHSSLEVVRRAEPLGFDSPLWERLRVFGIPSLAVSEAYGGGGATLAEQAIIAEEAGRSLAPAPVVESMVAGTKLIGHGRSDARIHTRGPSSRRRLQIRPYHSAHSPLTMSSG